MVVTRNPGNVMSQSSTIQLVSLVYTYHILVIRISLPLSLRDAQQEDNLFLQKGSGSVRGIHELRLHVVNVAQHKEFELDFRL